MTRSVLAISGACAVAIAAALALPPIALAQTEPAPRADAVMAKPKPAKAKTKRPARRVPAGYGFLPGYQPSLPNSIPVARRYGMGFTGSYYPQYWYRGRVLYGYGGPGFYRGRWNGGSIGPCYTQTPIGPMWNCGR